MKREHKKELEKRIKEYTDYVGRLFYHKDLEDKRVAKIYKYYLALKKSK